MINIILVVDDEECVRNTLKELLETRGYLVTVAVDGSDALKKLSKTEYDLIITDLRMPGLGGEQLINVIPRALLHRGKPILIYSGYLSKTDCDKIESLGYSYLEKPASIQELLEAIEKLKKWKGG
jgi:CheY-like chemotaxis protein